MTLQEAYSLHRDGQLALAEGGYREVLQTHPEDRTARYLMGVLLSDSGRFEEALPHLEVATREESTETSWIAQYAVALDRVGQDARCEAQYRRVAQRADADGFTLASFGLFLASRGRVAEAVVPMAGSVEKAPGVSEFWVNFGNVLRKIGRLPEAVHCFEQALVCDAQNAGAANCLGEVWQAQDDLDQAVEWFEKATALDSEYGLAWGNLGIALSKTGRIAAAEAAFDRAMQLQPAVASVVAAKASLLRDSCRVADGIALFRRALQLDPTDAAIVSKYLYTLNFSPDISVMEAQAELTRWAPVVAAAGPSGDMQRAKPPSVEGRRITVAFLSGDFCSHSVANFLLPLYGAIDRGQFRICSISETERADSATRSFKELSDVWEDARGRSAAEVAATLDALGVDVVVDLSGYTEGARLDVLAASRCPLKLTWLGYPNRLGLEQIDGRIVDFDTDPLDPAEGDATGGEPLLHMPRCFLCYQPRLARGEVGPLPALKRESGEITFGSFNNAAKINPSVAALWGAVLRAVPQSRLLLKSWQFEDTSVAERLREWFAAEGVEPSRIEFLARVPRYADHLQCYDAVDIALDTFPYNGTTTTCEAMLMGVPTLVRSGDRHAARVGVSLLKSVGLEDWIAHDDEAFVEKALAAASDLESLAALRAGLRERLEMSQLGDARDFADAFGAVLIDQLKKRSGDSRNET